ncbi:MULTISPECIES: hypothetical protein [unclassified Luteimonas]|uniref:hypothetical protein n=1 Tax=unclassified Luteimonas TaxID=2629088 RepID=UPI0018F088B1|nr:MULTISPECIES: hypothetical protein [unclassified Luteimonas]MBJ6978903.1 hypothetical protein [Luteimonas sp. MC1895]MBJ6984944.1 hypothetical protein [Luteimonas sp. MC1750]QQO05618.1 hypothetical protein JGR68_12480 [Luteimonas sp. MC1750]
MEHIRRACVALALLLALAWPGTAGARKNPAPAAAEPVRWVAPWHHGVALRYASEDYDVSVGEAGKARSRVTAIETIRITGVLEDGFVQAWSFDDSRYEQLEGDDGQEALMRQILEALPDLVLEVELDATGNFAALRNLDQLADSLRPVLRPAYDAAFERGVLAAGGWPDGAEGEAARARGREFAAGMVERMTRPEVLGALMSRDAQQYNDMFGAELAAGVPYAVDIEIDSPLGGGTLPAQVTLLMQPGAPGSDEATLEWTTRMDREKSAQLALAAAEQMYGIGVSAEDRAEVAADMSIVDTGRARFRRSTGVTLMLETQRTVEAAGERRIERRRMRLLDDAHGHAWPDDGEPRPADPSAEGSFS